MAIAAAVLKFILGPVGRWFVVGGVVLMAIAGIYGKGRVDGRDLYKAKIERQIKDAVEKGTDARDNSLRELDSGRVPDAWFRD